MIAIYILIFIAAWLACWVVAAGYVFAYFWREYPDLQQVDDRLLELQVFSLLYTPGGPFALLSVILPPLPLVKHGWLWPWSAKARREAGVDEVTE